MLGLRLDEPLALADVDDAVDRDALARLSTSASWSAGRTAHGDELRLTRRGRFLGGGVTAELLASRRRLTDRRALANRGSRGYHRTRCSSPHASARSCAASSRSTSRPVSRSARACSSSARGSRVSPSTVRGELAELEALGLLTHPHTSAGRTPTESGYRVYAEELVDGLEGRPDELGVDLRSMRDEIEQALRATTEMLSDATRLLALVSAPSLETASIRHVEVLTLQPSSVMVVVITSTGRRDEAGLPARRARRSGARRLGRRVPRGAARRPAARLAARVRRRLEAPELGPRERAFLALDRSDAARHRRRGRPRGLRRRRRGARRGCATEEVEATMRLVELLERRAAVLALVSEALEPQRPVVHVGPAVDGAELHSVSLVGATYGIRSTPLGAVGLVGPLRMDYEKAIRTVRAAAFELSRFVEDVYERRVMAQAETRLLRAARRPARRRATPRSSSRSASLARELHPDVSTRARRRPPLPRDRRGVRGALRPRAPRALRPLRARGASRAAASSRRSATSARSPTSSPPSSARTSAARRASAAGRRAGATCRSSPRSSSRRRSRGSQRASRSRSRSPASAATRRAPSRARRRGRARRVAAPARSERVSQNIFGQFVQQRPCPDCGGVGRRPRAAVRRLLAAKAVDSSGASSTSTSPPGSTTGSRSASAGKGTPASGARSAATPSSSCASVPTSGSSATVTTCTPRCA